MKTQQEIQIMIAEYRKAEIAALHEQIDEVDLADERKIVGETRGTIDARIHLSEAIGAQKALKKLLLKD